MRITQGNFIDETVIWNNPEATDGHDGDYDMRKRFSLIFIIQERISTKKIGIIKAMRKAKRKEEANGMYFHTR